MSTHFFTYYYYFFTFYKVCIFQHFPAILNMHFKLSDKKILLFYMDNSYFLSLLDFPNPSLYDFLIYYTTTIVKNNKNGGYYGI